jgi:hypothetical protein
MIQTEQTSCPEHQNAGLFWDSRPSSVHVRLEQGQISDRTDTLEVIQTRVEEGARLGLIYKYRPMILDKELEGFGFASAGQAGARSREYCRAIGQDRE